MNTPAKFTNVDEALAHADSARELSLREQKLRALPKEMARLKHLEVLDISINPLQTLPTWLFELKALRVLNINCTGIKAIPAEIGALSELEELSVGGFDPITQLPAAVVSLPKLRKLDLTDATHLVSLPDLSAATALKELFLVRTQKLKNVDELLQQLPALDTLILNAVSLSTFPDEPGPLANLRSLQISETSITELPSWLGMLDKLEHLYIEDNEDLESLTDELGRLSALKDLYIGLSMTVPLPASLGKLSKLEQLSLVSCGLTEIPAWVFGLENLQRLYVGVNPLERLHSDFSKLKNLRHLDLGFHPNLCAQREQLRSWLPQCEILLEG